MSNASRRHARWLGAVALSALIAGTAAVELRAPALAQAETAAPITVTPQAPMPSFADVVEKVKPAVVSVRVRLRQDAAAGPESGGERGPGRGALPDLPDGHPLERFFRQFRDQDRFGDRGDRGGDRFSERGDRRGPQGPRRQSQGSGFFVSADGYVVTNNHVVDKGDTVQVVTEDGRSLDAKVVGTDPKTDLAVLKVTEPGTFPHVKLAGAAPRVGDWVVAIGNPFGLGGTVTAGIVSARGRDIGAGPYDDFLQIDAPVNRGNSGGPTFNLSGEVVGINTAIFSPSGGNVGIAFAIPAESASRVVAELREKGAVERGFIGVQIQPVTKEIAEAIGLKEPRGALVAEAVADGPAAKAGLRTGDTILAVDGQTVREAKDLSRRIAGVAPGRQVELRVYRDGKERTVTFEVGRQKA